MDKHLFYSFMKHMQISIARASRSISNDETNLALG